MLNRRLQSFGSWLVTLIIIVLVVSGLYATSLFNYLLFHSLAEMFSIIVACSIFAITWNARRFINNNYFLLVGVAYLFVGLLDLIHTLAYKGMNVFPGYDTNLPTQLWIGARYLQSISLLVAVLLIGRKRIRAASFFFVYVVIVSLLLASIFSGVFPTSYGEGMGLTPFKIASEYIICVILLISTILLWLRRETFDRHVLNWLIAANVITIVSELTFTSYASVYGLANTVGHLLKLVAFYCVYVAIISTAIQKPFDLLFKELKRSEDRYRGLFEDAPIPLVETDYSAVKAYVDGLRAAGVTDLHAYFGSHPSAVAGCRSLVKIISVNRATLDLYRAPTVEQFKAGMDKLFTKESYDAFREDVISLMEGAVTFEGEYNYRAFTGERIDAALRWRVMPGYENTLGRVQLSIVDLTERKRMEARVIRAQRMETVGRLAGGLAHSFNNLLTSLMGYAQFVQWAVSPDDTTREDIDQVISSGQSLADLTQHLLAFAQRQVLMPRRLVLNELISSMEPMFFSLGQDNIVAEVSLDPELWEVTADPSQLEQVMLDLVLNAQAAMSGGGRLVVKTANTSMGETGSRAQTDLPPGDYVMLTISDTGVGMNEETLSHIFEPFYSERDLTEADGLGLAVAYGIVKQHGGDIRVQSEPGRGSRFEVYLPRAN